MELARQASLVSLTTHLLLPIQVAALLALPLTGLGWSTAAALASYSLGVGILVAAFELRHLEAMPFTREEDALDTDFGAQVATALVLAALGAGFSQVADSPLGAGLGLAVLFIGVKRLLRGRRDGS